MRKQTQNIISVLIIACGFEGLATARESRVIRQMQTIPYQLVIEQIEDDNTNQRFRCSIRQGMETISYFTNCQGGVSATDEPFLLHCENPNEQLTVIQPETPTRTDLHAIWQGKEFKHRFVASIP